MFIWMTQYLQRPMCAWRPWTTTRERRMTSSSCPWSGATRRGPWAFWGRTTGSVSLCPGPGMASTPSATSSKAESRLPSFPITDMKHSVTTNVCNKLIGNVTIYNNNSLPWLQKRHFIVSEYACLFLCYVCIYDLCSPHSCWYLLICVWRGTRGSFRRVYRFFLS